MSLLHQDITGEILEVATKIHRVMGIGLLESVYEECLCFEFSRRGVPFL